MKRLLKAFLYSCILAFLTLFSASILWQSPIYLTLVLAIISVLMLLVWRSREDLYLYVIVFITGGIAEAFAISFGTWTYPLPNIIGIPIWLPFVWGISALFIKRISLEIHDFLKK